MRAAGNLCLPRHSKFSFEVLCDADETSLDSCACLDVRIPQREGEQSAAVSREYVPGVALADDWPYSRRADSRVRWCAWPAECFLCRSGEWRRVENGRFRPHVDSNFRRSAIAG